MKKQSQLKLTYFMTVLALMPLFILSFYFIYKSRADVLNEKTDKIHELAKAKQTTLENHLQNYIKNLNSFAKNKIIINSLKNNKFDDSVYQFVKQFQENMWGPSHHIFIADPKGNIVLSPYHGKNKKSSHFGHSISSSKYFKPSLKETQVTDFYGFEESTHYHQLVMVPIKSGGKTHGVIISEITIQYFLDLLAKDFKLGKSGQVYLSTLDFQKVEHSKEVEIGNVSNPLLQQAFAESDGYGETKNSNGTEVLGAYLKSKNFPWILAVEIDKSEVLASINKTTTILSFAYGIYLFIFLFIFSRIVRMLKKPVQDVSETLTTISHDAVINSSKMGSSTRHLEEGSLQLAEALVENQGQLEKVVGDIKDDTSLIKKSLDISVKAKTASNEGSEVVEKLTQSIQDNINVNEQVQNEFSKVMKDITSIVESIKVIQDKTNLINDIVFQTKLLSFNASVEAARAGEHGKGFAVVAEEVGNLANMSGSASVEIQEMINESVQKVQKVVTESQATLTNVLNLSSEKLDTSKVNVEACFDLFNQISKCVIDVHENIDQISQSSIEKTSAIDEVNDRFIALKAVSEKSTAVAKDVGSLTKKLHEDSTKLEEVSKELSAKFAA
jgi:methyl-accepting chemotaxis protein